MSHSRILLDTFYTLKPLISRRLQLYLRRQLAQRQRDRHAETWPILERARQRPVAWAGWPEDKQFAFVLIHDVETMAGQDKCRSLMKLEMDRGFRSCFNFVPERYAVSERLRMTLAANGFEIGVHGLNHDGKLFRSARVFNDRAAKINYYLNQWDATGFCSPSSHHRLEWNHLLHIDYDSSTFDTDPFEVQPDGIETIFPVWVRSGMSASDQLKRRQSGQLELGGKRGYVELPYTLAQDFYLFILLRETTISTWRDKIDWIADCGGLALLITHPDYMNFGDNPLGREEYGVDYYLQFLEYVQEAHCGQFWHALPKAAADWYRSWALKVGEEPQEEQGWL